MSTSRYSKPDVTSPSRTDQYPERGMGLQFPFRVAPNTRRKRLLYTGAFWALLVFDLLAIAGATERVEAATFVGITLLNVAVMLHVTR